MGENDDEGARSNPEGSQTHINLSPEGNLNIIPPSLVHAAAVNGDKSLLQRLLHNEYEMLNQGDQFGRTPLVYSVLGDRLECAELLLKAGANVNKHDEDQRTPLHWASYQGNHKCVKLLLTKGATWKEKDNDGRTPLHFATSHDSSKCLRVLLKRVPRGEADEPDNDGMTALHWSVSFDNIQHTKLLLKAGAAIRSCDKQQKSPLHWAASNKLPTIAKLFLDQNPEIINWQDSEGRTALHLAIAQENEAMVETLISYDNCDVTKQDKIMRSPLHWAAVLGNSKIVKRLLQRNADYTVADGNGATALHYVAQGNFTNAVEVMLSFPFVRDIPDNEGKTALMWAASKGADAALLVMLRKKLDVNGTDKTGGTALHASAYAGHLSCTRLLLEHNADLNAFDMMNHTPLFRACEQGHTDVVALLLSKNAAVDLEDQDGHSPLHWAALGGYSYICQMLIQKGVDADKKDNRGRTPLHCAAFGGFVNCMSVLLENGANVNMQDKRGVTALHWSCSNGQLQAVKLLLNKYNAFPNYQSREERGERLTPLDYAISGDNDEVAQYMVEQGAFTIEGIRDVAAMIIQNRWKGYQMRKSFQNRKNLLMRHEQLKKNSKKRSNSIDKKKSELQWPQKFDAKSDDVSVTDEVQSTIDTEEVNKQKGNEQNVAIETSMTEGKPSISEGKKVELFNHGERGAGDGQTDDESSTSLSVTKSTTGKPHIQLNTSALKDLIIIKNRTSNGRKASEEMETISSKCTDFSENREQFTTKFEDSSKSASDTSTISENNKNGHPENGTLTRHLKKVPPQAEISKENTSGFVKKEPIKFETMSGGDSALIATIIDKHKGITETVFLSYDEKEEKFANRLETSSITSRIKTESDHKASYNKDKVKTESDLQTSCNKSEDRNETALETSFDKNEEKAGIGPAMSCELWETPREPAVPAQSISSTSVQMLPVLSSKIDRYRLEKERVNVIRKKVSAAVTIQQAFRIYRKRNQELTKHQEIIARFRKENEEIKRQVAALTIQSTWHKHHTQQLKSSSNKRIENLNKLSESVSKINKKHNIRGNTLQSGSLLHTSPKIQRARKHDGARFRPSSAALSYNLAVDLYHPLVARQGDRRAAKVAVDGTRVRPKSMKRTTEGWVLDSPPAPLKSETWRSKSKSRR